MFTLLSQSIKKEFASHTLEVINDGILTNDNIEEIHHHLFNEDYYIIGYYQASQWLKRHDIDPFEAISYCIEYEKDHFGEVLKSYSNSEETVNMLAYVLGYEFLANFTFETIEELKEQLSEL